MTYYYSKGASQLLAKDVEAQALKKLNWPVNNELRTGMLNDELYVLTHNTRPSVLVEG